MVRRNTSSRPNRIPGSREISNDRTHGTLASGFAGSAGLLAFGAERSGRWALEFTIGPFLSIGLLGEGVPDNVIAKHTGHKSKELERYKHLFPELRQQTVQLIDKEVKIPQKKK